MIKGVGLTLWRQYRSDLVVDWSGKFSGSRYQFRRGVPRVNNVSAAINQRRYGPHAATARKPWSSAMLHLRWVRLGHGGMKRPYASEPRVLAIGWARA